jgi:hypothetical protein
MMHMFYAFVQLQIFGKAEFLNPGGSVKDRVAAKILDEVRIPVQVFVPSFDSPADPRMVTIGSSYPSLVVYCMKRLKSLLPLLSARKKVKLVKIHH